MDDEEVVRLVNYITSVTSVEYGKYSTKYGGKFKFGLSSPYYIEDANNLKTAFDGRKMANHLMSIFLLISQFH